MRQTFPGSVRSVGEREFKFTAVTAKLGRDGDILEPSGVELSEYRKMPVVLWQHIPTSPVARCSSTALVDGEMRGTAEFAPAGTSAVVDEAFGCVKSGVVGAVSIGFDIVSADPIDAEKGSRGGLHIKRSTLLEVSLVSIPPDVGALITARAHRSDHMSKQIIRASEAISEARRHHHDLRVALEDDEPSQAMRARQVPRRCRKVPARAQRQHGAGGADFQRLELRHIGLPRGLVPIRTAASCRAAAPQRAAALCRRARCEVARLMLRPPVWNGESLAHWTAAIREYLESDALARSRSYICPLPLSRAQRQADLARLTRSE